MGLSLVQNKRNSPALDPFLEKLKVLGFVASNTHSGIKSSLQSLKILRLIIIELCVCVCVFVSVLARVCMYVEDSDSFLKCSPPYFVVTGPH